MKQQDMIVLGLAAVAVVLIFKATKGKKSSASGTWGGASGTSIRSPFGNPFDLTYITQAEQDAYNKSIGL